MILATQRRTIGTFSTLDQAIRALDFLALSGFPPAQLSLVGRDVVQIANLHPIEAMRGLVKQSQDEVMMAEPGATRGLVIGNLTGGMGGVLLGVALLGLPGLGPVMLGSAIALTFSGGIIGAAIGGCLGTLVEVRWLERQAQVDCEHIAQGHYLLIVTGTPEELRCAESMVDALAASRRDR